MLLPISYTKCISHLCGDTELSYSSYQESYLMQISGSHNFQLYQECINQFRARTSALVQ